MATLDEMIKRKGGQIGLMTMLMHLNTTLSAEDLRRFVDKTPDGDAFWQDFKSRQRNSDNEDYGYNEYVQEILAKK